VLLPSQSFIQKDLEIHGIGITFIQLDETQPAGSKDTIILEDHQLITTNLQPTQTCNGNPTSLHSASRIFTIHLTK